MNTTPPIEKRSSSIAELAERYGISQRTVYSHIARGGLQVTKIGRRSIVTPENERAWLASLPTRSGSQAA